MLQPEEQKGGTSALGRVPKHAIGEATVEESG